MCYCNLLILCKVKKPRSLRLRRWAQLGTSWIFQLSICTCHHLAARSSTWTRTSSTRCYRRLRPKRFWCNLLRTRISAHFSYPRLITASKMATRRIKLKADSPKQKRPWLRMANRKQRWLSFCTARTSSSPSKYNIMAPLLIPSHSWKERPSQCSISEGVKLETMFPSSSSCWTWAISERTSTSLSLLLPMWSILFCHFSTPTRPQNRPSQTKVARHRQASRTSKKTWLN